jgi:Gram-negative bacterial TonB protein C-terminal
MSIRKTASTLAVVALATTLMAGTAIADIKAFNAAVKAGDHKTASMEAKEIWKTWDRGKSDTALMAREFGFVSYVAGDYVAAKEFGQFLKDHGASLGKPDDQPATSRVLLAVADFRLAVNDATRSGLFEALKSREAVSGIDFTSVLAAEALYKDDWSKRSWGKAAGAAELAWRLLGRAGDQLAPRALDARATYAAAEFLAGPDKTDYDKIVDAHDAVVAHMNASLDPSKRLAVVPLKFRLQAWAISAGMYLKSADQVGTITKFSIKERELASPTEAIFPDGVRTGDQCQDPILDWPKINYPATAEYRGMVGTVIMKVDTDREGRVSKWETLAAVPAQHFAREVENAMDGLRYRRGPDDAPNCGLAATSRTVLISFRML